VPLAGVGKNLQDRYEIAIVNRMKKPWEALEGATFSNDDPLYRQWSANGEGVYSTNGAVACVIARSTVGTPSPDLFCYALIGDFRGYAPKYSTAFPAHHDRLTWVVLKGHTNNTGGEVTLKSADPRATPAINFRYFDEGTGVAAEDLNAVVQGINLVRRMTAGLKKELGVTEEFPGDSYDTDEKLQTFVRNQAWGHHASCTCAIGPREHGGVLTSDFKVHGTEGLRVVDASVFPRVPGLFIVSAIYMIGEKAADVLIADAKKSS
jgi:choline dehydrogenase-like flavoprotein